MTPGKLDEVQARALFIACGLGVALLAAAVLLVVGLKRPGSGGAVIAAPKTATRSGDPTERARRAPHAKVPRGRLFARTSFWNRALSVTVPIDPSSTVLVQALVAEIQRERTANIGPWIGGHDTTSLYRVGRAEPRVRVRLDGRNFRGGAALQRAFASVPIPRDAKAAAGPDRHMTVWQPSTDTLWEFFKARRRSDGWRARWGGAIRHVSKNPGYYTPAAWPGATTNWGATASSLPVIGGTMLLDELKAGRIDHALAINLPAPRADVFAWPAQRTDGTGPPTALPEGARLRLDADVDVGALRLPKLTQVIATAAQRYGLVVRDQTGHAVSLFLGNRSQLPREAYSAYFKDRTPQDLLAHFPWDRLQVLKMHLCTRAPCRRDG